jgi:hypothetical protein
MRVAEVVRSALDGIERVVDLHEGDLDLAVQLALPDGVELVRAAAGARAHTSLDTRTLVVDVLGPDARHTRPIVHVEDALGALLACRRALVLLTYPLDELPVGDLLQSLGDAACQLVAAVPVESHTISSALVIERRVRLDANGDDLNRLRLAALTSTVLDTRLQALEHEVDDLRAQLPRADDEHGEARTELERLRDDVDALRVDRQRLQELERSTTYHVGRVVIDVLSKPGKGAVRAPGALWKLWRERSDRRSYKTASPGEPRGRPRVAVRASRLLNPHPLPIDADLTGMLTIAGVWPAESERLLAPDARAVTLHPNQATRQVQLVEPDVLLVQSSAARPGSPWAALGSAPAAARDLELLDVLREAERREIPAVLWFDDPAHLVPGLDALAGHFDVVLRDHGPWADTEAADAFDLGVQLARFGVLGPCPTPPGAGVRFLGALDPRLGVRRHAQLRATLEAAVDAGLRWFDDGSTDDVAGAPIALPAALAERRDGYLPANRRAETYRAHRAWIAMPPRAHTATWHRRTVEQLAAGAHVVLPAAAPIDGELKPRVFDASSDPRAALAAAQESFADDAQLAVLRDLYLRASTQRWLARLARAANLALDPAAAYATTVGFLDVTAADADRVVAAVLGQRLRPACVALGLGASTSAADVEGLRAALARAGVDARVVAHGGARAIVEGVTTPWTTFMPAATTGPDHLLDLHVARACSAAAAVAFAGAGAAAPTLVRTDAITRGDVVLAGASDDPSWDARPGTIATFGTGATR